jgi:hypothetical protein
LNYVLVADILIVLEPLTVNVGVPGVLVPVTSVELEILGTREDDTVCVYVADPGVRVKEYIVVGDASELGLRREDDDTVCVYVAEPGVLVLVCNTENENVE